MPRLFIAIPLPDDVKAMLTHLRADIAGAAWVKPPAMHLTLRFLGDLVEAARVPTLKAALGEIKVAQFSLTLQGVGRFPPNARRPARVLWVGLATQPALNALYREIERVVVGLGFPPDDHDFSAHITLARLKSDRPLREVDEFLAAHQQFQAPPFLVTQYTLYASVLSPQGPNYTPERIFPLIEL
jgi:RNA 2',3'-cyclic 3'-phosphodiesterase